MRISMQFKMLTKVRRKFIEKKIDHTPMFSFCVVQELYDQNDN